MNVREWLRHHGATLAALALVALFVAQGCAFIDLLGIQEDEALFGSALFRPKSVRVSVPAFGREIPLMLDYYLGCLKAWIYRPIFAVWRPSVYSLRTPVLLAAAFTVWLFYRLMRRAVGTWAAVAACALLACDTMFVLTSLSDWGPVVLQHLLAVLMLWLLVRFHETGRRQMLAWAAFCGGLALWDKAAFAWTLAGFVVAGCLVYRREVIQALRWRNVLIAAGCGAVGALPFIVGNWGAPGRLVASAGGFAIEAPAHKLAMLRSTLDGSSLFGLFNREDTPEKPAPPDSIVDRTSVAVSDALGGPRSHYLPWAVVAAVVLIPILWRTPARRPMLFSLVAAGVAWLILASARLGGASHHAVLLWPLPHMLVGTAAGGLARWRWRHAGKLVAVLLLAVCLSSLAVTNHYLAEIVRKGASVGWTDASNALWRFLERTRPGSIYVLDWGVAGPLRLLGKGRLPLAGWLPMEAGWEVRGAQRYGMLISTPQNCFVAHVKGSELFPGRREPLAGFAQRHGYREHVWCVVRDRHSRPVFEVFYFLPAMAQGTGARQ